MAGKRRGYKNPTGAAASKPCDGAVYGVRAVACSGGTRIYVYDVTDVSKVNDSV